jgi:hypothetical protein
MIWNSTTAWTNCSTTGSWPTNKLPPELASLQDRRAKMNAVLNELRNMDARRKKNGIDPAKNPAQLPKTDLDSRILPNKEGE